MSKKKDPDFLDEDEEALVRAIRNNPDPVHKLVYADWLEEHGQDDLAYAYRWAAHRDKHPASSMRSWVWRDYPKHGPCCLPPSVMRAITSSRTKVLIGDVTLAFQVLARALKQCKEDCAP